MEARPLRLLVVSSAPPVKRLPALFFELLDCGASLVFSTPAGGLPDELRERVETVELPLRPSGDSVEILRAAADLTRYLGPDLAGARWPRRRATRRLLKLVGHPDANRIAAQSADFELPAEVHATAARAFRDLEQLIPADNALVDAIDRLQADAVLIVSRSLLGGPEPDVIKAARQLGLPSVMLVWSWDNLSSKAVQNEHPDRLLVWNELQAREAVELHGMRPERVTVVGAANFDAFFDELAGVEPVTHPPTILYLGSSPKVASLERDIFERWLAAVRPLGARVVLRPHPAAQEAWAGWVAPPDVETVEPKAKIEPKALSRLLAEADAVVALNTSAEIEAAIAGKPVLTFRAGPEARGQEGSIHFTYLLEQNGGFVLDALTPEEHAEKLGAVLRGEWDPEPLRLFVERFVRPNGLERPVTPLLAETIREAAGARVAPTGRPVAPSSADRPKDKPRILVFTPPGLTRFIPDVFVELLDAEATLVFSGRRQKRPRIPSELKSSPHVEFVELPVEEPGAVELLRAFRDAVRFHDPELEAASWPRRRATRRLLKLARHPDWKRDLPDLERLRIPHETCARIDQALSGLELLLPPASDLRNALEALDLDLVFLVTRCTLSGHEGTVVKAARALGLPTLMLVWSWDNLSSKAVLHEQPDRLLVWNETQAREADELQSVDPERVEVVGAPNFDRFFAAVEAAGDRRDGNTILYLGSSTNVVPDEPSIFARWLEAVRAQPSLRDAEVVVRPYPAGAAWLDWKPPDERVSLQRPAKKVEPEALAELLAQADAVVALNTSAEIEAAIAGRPVLTFRAGEDAPGQEGSLHFTYLLEQNGGFVLDAATLDDHVTQLARTLAGAWDVGPVERFVERFVRPRGLAEPVAPIVAAAALELAGAQPAQLGGAA
jgi:CDP-glycerol glycerophosphotransferase (TagB/SpsB family)